MIHLLTFFVKLQVKYWMTMREPDTLAVQGYELGTHAPGSTSSGADVYTVAYIMLKAHARVYRLYSQQFKDTQKGQNACHNSFCTLSSDMRNEGK